MASKWNESAEDSIDLGREAFVVGEDEISVGDDDDDVGDDDVGDDDGGETSMENEKVSVNLDDDDDDAIAELPQMIAGDDNMAEVGDDAPLSF